MVRRILLLIFSLAVLIGMGLASQVVST